jgi:hypothetical protein
MGYEKGDFDHVVDKFPEERKSGLDWLAWNAINDPAHPSHRLAKTHLGKRFDLNHARDFPYDLNGGAYTQPVAVWMHDTVRPIVGGYLKLVGYVFGFWWGSR